MRNVLGVLLMVAGVLFGVYVGVWLCLVGGIVQIVQSVQGSSVDALGIAFGIVRVLGTGFAGGITAVVAVIPGYAMMKA